MAVSPDGMQVATGHGVGAVALWAAGGGTLLRSFAGHSNAVTSVAFSPDGTKVLTGSTDMTAKLWSAADGTLLRTLKGHSDQVMSGVFSPDGKAVLTGSMDGTTLLWDISQPVPPAPKILSGIMLSPRGPFQIRLQGETGVANRLEGSTNLVDWSALMATNSSTAIWEWIDSQSVAFPQRFYRAVSP
jgi:WD40 repeat protein